jgi:hypothetical protein
MNCPECGWLLYGTVVSCILLKGGIVWPEASPY